MCTVMPVGKPDFTYRAEGAAVTVKLSEKKSLKSCEIQTYLWKCQIHSQQCSKKVNQILEFSMEETKLKTTAASRYKYIWCAHTL